MYLPRSRSEIAFEYQLRRNVDGQGQDAEEESHRRKRFQRGDQFVGPEVQDDADEEGREEGRAVTVAKTPPVYGAVVGGLFCLFFGWVVDGGFGRNRKFFRDRRSYVLSLRVDEALVITGLRQARHLLESKCT